MEGVFEPLLGGWWRRKRWKLRGLGVKGMALRLLLACFASEKEKNLDEKSREGDWTAVNE